MFARKRRIDLDTARSLILGAFALGGGLMYFYDQESGLKRRTQAREKLGRGREKVRDELQSLKSKGKEKLQAGKRKLEAGATAEESRDSLF